MVVAVERLRDRTAAVRLADSPLEDDLGQMVDFLAAAAWFGDRGLFTDHLEWLARVSAPRGAAVDLLPAVLEAFRAELHDFPFALTCLDLGRDALVGRA